MGFKPITFPSERKLVREDVAISIHRSQPGRVKFRFRGATAKKMGLKKGDKLTPLIDKKEFLVLFVVNSDRPSGAERMLRKRGSGFEAEFPRKDEFAEFFQGVGICAAKVLEHGLHRIVIEGGVVIGKEAS